MNVIDDLTKANLHEGLGDKRPETILTIGAFDGVHRGHQALIGQVVARARATNRRSVVLTFHPHPAMVLAPERAPRYLTTPGEKMALLEGLGVDLVVLHPFSQEVAATPAGEFMTTLAEHLQFRELWVGSDFALGRGREGTVPRLRDLGDRLGYRLFVLDPLQGRGGAVSSSRIRALLAEGRVEEASHLLGRYPSLSGEVVYGAQRGHTLGFPTANLEVRPERAVPANGVYAVFAVLGEDRYPAVANVGVRPSFDNGHRTVETHIFDFDQDIYGCDLVVEFVTRLRNERRFEDIDDLVSQITHDSETARRILDAELHAPRSKQPAAGSWRRTGVPCPYRYQEIEHTADRALRIWGRELPDLFTGAARGMYSLMADLDGLVTTDWLRVELEALDGETLLVDWLNELLFLTETEGLLFVECIIESLQDDKLVARAGGIRAPLTKAHIKAATFHNLALVQDSTGWSVVLTFDV
ncbi:MAG: bifunctional riboflavin kinase/FAD synthetase [Anaerolineae bacterium]|jgi:riboflavin kinase/FMN adenylyltransferase